MVVFASLIALVVFGGIPLGEIPSVEEPVTETWAGHQILRGLRHLPIYGDVPVETQNYVIAKVRHRGNGLEFRQYFCRVEPQPIDGVTVALAPAGVARMPATTLTVAAGRVVGSTSPPGMWRGPARTWTGMASPAPPSQ